MRKLLPLSQLILHGSLPVHHTTIRRWIAHGDLPARRIGGRYWLDPADLAAALAGVPIPPAKERAVQS
jgi:excisionase family DNA binding protein